MNKYIKTDIRQAETFMKAAIMNALHDVDSGEETYINLGPNISHNLFVKCLEESECKPANGKFYSEIGDFYSDIDFEADILTPSGKTILATFGNPDYSFNSQKKVQVSISMTLSSFQEIEVDGSFDETDEKALKDKVLDQIYLPTDGLKDACYDKEWTLDDFTVVQN